MPPERCTFCRIRDEELPAEKVLDEGSFLAFLDTRPLFPGHVLLIPRAHHVTLMDLPIDLVSPLFLIAQRVCAAVQRAMAADGILMVANNGVSQSVDHLHLNIVPRRRKDGLRGFLWPRHTYADDAEAASIAVRIRQALAKA